MTNPYQTPSAEVTEANSDAPVELASFWQRFFASLIDSIWVMLLAIVLGWFIYGKEYFESDAYYHGAADIFISYVLPFIITVTFWIYRSATPGKMAMNIIIVDVNSLQQPSKQQLVLRYVGYYLSTVVFFLGFLWVIWDAKKQGWHDKIASTIVIRARP